MRRAPVRRSLGSARSPAAREARRRAFGLVVLLLGLTVAAGAVTLVSVEEEIAAGRAARAALRREAPLLPDAAIVQYVESVGRRLVGRTQGPRYPFSFDVVDDGDVNAFALPGGPVWVHRGALQLASTEAQLAGVLAHEVAHISERHAADQLTRTTMARWGLGLLGALLGNTGGAMTAQAAAQFAAGGTALTFSREDEREADRIGAGIMRRAGWDPRGMLEFLDRLQRASKRDPGAVEIFFSTHPAPADRVERLRAVLPTLPGGTRDSARFREMRSRLRRLPPARSWSRERRAGDRR